MSVFYPTDWMTSHARRGRRGALMRVIGVLSELWWAVLVVELFALAWMSILAQVVFDLP